MPFEKSRDKFFISKRKTCKAHFFTILRECSAQILKCFLTLLNIKLSLSDVTCDLFSRLDNLTVGRTPAVAQKAEWGEGVGKASMEPFHNKSARTVPFYSL